MQENTYKKFAKYYDEYVKGFSDDLNLYYEAIKGKDRILEVGCGTGRVLKGILEKGYNVDGIDISEEMLEIAREKLYEFIENGNLKLINHNFAELEYGQKYEVILVTFYTFNYILEEHQAEIFLQNLRNSLEENGVLIMDLFYPSSLINPEINDKWIKKDFRYEETEYQILDKRTMNGYVEERVQQYINLSNNNIDEITTNRRYYKIEDMLSILKRVGFEEIEVINGYGKEEKLIKSNYVIKVVK